MQGKKKVVVIGAGLSGLSAAEEILKNVPGCEVTVLEALDRVGGRTYSVPINGTIYDLGAEWIGPPHKYVQELANRSKNQLIYQCHEGTKVLDLKKNPSQYASDIPSGIGIIPLLQMQWAIWKVDRMAKSVPLDNPRNCKNSAAWDAITVHTWIQQNIWFEKVRKLFECCVRAVCATEANQISFLFFLWFVHQNHGINSLINVKQGLQEKKMKFGTQYLSIFLQKQVEGLGGKVLLNQFVHQIKQSKHGCQVITKDNVLYECDELIMGIPPFSTKKIQFQPSLSRDRRYINQRYLMGHYTKILLLYDQRYWKDRGYSGEIVTDGEDGPISMGFDDTRAKENGEMQPGIVIFVAGGVDREWTQDRELCIQTAKEKVASYFKCAELLNPVAVEMEVWNQNEVIGGAPISYFPPGVLSAISSLREPEGRIHWAGTQMATVSMGYMDGAVESGIRAAKQVITRFSNHQEQINPKERKKNLTDPWYSKIIKSKRKWFEWW